MKELDLKEIQELCDNTAPAPWRVVNDNEGMPKEFYPFWVICHGESCDDGSEWFAELHVGCREDAEFIARSRELIPAMLAEIQALRAELTSAVEDMKETHCMGMRCYICKHSIDCKRKRVEVGYCGMFEWRGKQEAQP